MTEKEMFECFETKMRVFQRDNYECQVCGKSIYHYGAPQLAHIKSKSKVNINKYGKEYIHSDNNLKSCCSLTCNAKVMKNDKR